MSMTPPWSTGCFRLRRVAPEGRPLPDFNLVHKELKSRKSVTLQLLWEEYREAYPEGFN
jgi:transposase